MNRPGGLYWRVLSFLLTVLTAGLAFASSSAVAEVPDGPPEFSNPSTIDNAFFPFSLNVRVELK